MADATVLPIVYLDNPWTFRLRAVVKIDAATGEDALAVGETGLIGYFAASETSTTPLGGVTVALSEPVSGPGKQVGTMATAVVATVLAGLTTAWEVIEKTGSYRERRKVQVQTVR